MMPYGLLCDRYDEAWGKGVRMKKLCLVLAIALVACVGCGCVAAKTNQQSSSDSANGISEEDQWNLVFEAYRYTFPLMMTDWTMKAATNVEAPDLAGHAPKNQLIHAQKLADAESKLVVTPNVDTIYTQAWLDLSEEPMVFVMPQTDRFFQTQVLDAWTNTPAVLEAGSYVIARQGWSGDVPEGMTLVEVPTDTTWLLCRILANGDDDMDNVRAIQAGMQLMPLSAYLSGEDYTPPAGEVNEDYDVVPVDALLSMTPQDYFSTANSLMSANPPADADADILARISAIGVGPGLQFDASALQGDVSTQWKTMLQQLKQTLADAGTPYQGTLGNWTYYGDPIGNFGTAYDYRAMIALGGLGANPLDVAVYCRTDTDAQGQTLNGQNSYVLHFDSMPPVESGGFWSVTAYGSDNFLIANPLGRYCINDRSDFVKNADGSLDIVLSAQPPENQANWLPVGTDDFHLYLRIYLPNMDEVQGEWSAPTIMQTS